MSVQRDDTCRDAIVRCLAAGVDAYWWHGQLAEDIKRSGPTNHVAAASNIKSPSMDVRRWTLDLIRAGVLREVELQWAYEAPGLLWVEYVESTS